MARACCGLKRVPVGGCRRKCPGTPTCKFFLAMQTPATITLRPPIPRKIPSTISGTVAWCAVPELKIMIPPEVISRMPRQSSVPWWIDISGAPALRGVVSSCSRRREETDKDPRLCFVWVGVGACVGGAGWDWELDRGITGEATTRTSKQKADGMWATCK